MKKAAAMFSMVMFGTVGIRGEEPAPTRHISARLMQMPAVSADHLAFVYAGDIWIAPKNGGAAVRLSSPRGSESFPRFSPDGSELAFSGNYEGNTDIYVMPVTGGEPRRVTHHGASDRMLAWFPDGKSLLFQSTMASFTSRVGQLYQVDAQGGLPKKLPVPYGEFGAISSDGKWLAYTPISTDFATWKRYRGGMAPDIWLFNLESGAAENITGNEANDSQPMWHGATLYFVSDRDPSGRENIWAYQTETKALRQVTKFTDFDVHFPSMGPHEIVFENGGGLFLLDLATEQTREVHVTVVTDRATLRPRVENVSNFIRSAAISPTGKRALFEARGDIFSVPAEHGVIRNLTESSGVAERFPAWSPDGKWIAYFSDRTGEYELTLRPAEPTTAPGKNGEQTVTSLGAGFRYQPQWSPDSKKLVFVDNAMRIYLHDLESKKTEAIDRQMWQYSGQLARFQPSWSADSRWLAYECDLDNRQTAIVLYDTREKKRHQVTSGFYDDDLPAFDPDGKYLYYRTKRWFDPIYSDFEPTWVYANGQALVAVPLRNDVASPLAPRNDDEPLKKEPPHEDKKEAPKKEPAPGGGNAAQTKPPTANQELFEVALEERKSEAPGDAASSPKAGEKSDRRGAAAEARKPKPVEIDVDGFEARGVVLPPGGGQFADLIAIPGKLLFTRYPRAGSGTGTHPLSVYDLEKREEKMIFEDAEGVELSADGKKLLVLRGRQWGIINALANDAQKLDKPLNTGSFEALIDPPSEWRQIFTDAWRMERDFFYDPNMHGVDWKGMRDRYGRLLADAVTRWDVNHILGELLGELNVSHAYRSGGDLESAASRAVGYLGCDFSLEQGAYRIARILEGAAWDLHIRSPLQQPGLKVKAGDWLLAINGHRLDPAQDPWAALQGLANKPVFLTVNDKPSLEGAHEVLVQTLASESTLRQHAWIEANRRRVDEATGGRVGYIYVPNTGIDGQNELFRQFRAQFMKQGLVVDERWNSGGQIPDRFIELLARRATAFWAVRDGRDWQTPFIAHNGPKVILANGWSGSGGDCFPWLFRKLGLGPIIGQRTWGGLIGITGTPQLIDGGSVTVPTFSIYDTTGEWIIEGRGVEPDIEVVDDPSQLARGTDPQLERAIAEVTHQLDTKGPLAPKKPGYPIRSLQTPATLPAATGP
jgi:tricorn protease